MVWTGFEFLGDYSLFLAERRVSKWPHPQTVRTKCDFRFALGEGKPYPRPGRFVCQMFGVPEELTGRAYPVIDLDVSGDFELFGSSGVNAHGRSVELEVIQHLTADFPGSDSPGIEYHFTFKKVGDDDYNWTWYFESVAFPGGPIEIPMDVHSSTGGIPIKEVFDDPQFLDVDWPVIGGTSDFVWFGMSPCWDFSDMPPIVGAAQFNGIDAYIALDNSITIFNEDHIIELEVRLHDTTGHWPVFGREAAGGFIGMEDEFFIYGAIKQFTSWTPVLDVWFTWRMEFEQTGQLKYELFIDDVAVGERVANRFNTPIDNIGVFRHNTPGTIWANADFRNLKVWNGNNPSTDLQLDMPLQINARDLSPQANHGTTFNMILPST